MRLEIRDLESSMVYDIGADGAVMGRERAKTDISFRDESISKRHARIYFEGGTWYLEDLGSSNGTYVDDQRVSGPVVLNQGAIFSLAQKRFEVVFADAGNGAAAADDFPPLGVPSARSAEMPPPASQSGPGGDKFEPDGDEIESKGFGYFFIAVPKAIAFYMAKVPLMVVNPIGTIRKGIEEQKYPAMGKMELIAYAIPAFVFSFLLSGIMGFIVTAVTGTIGAALLSLLTLWLPPLYGLVAALVAGFIWHPFMRWVINFLKGESTAKSRTNCALMFFTLFILIAIPQNIGVLLALIPIPFIGIVPAVLGVGVSGIMLLFMVRWAKHFQLVKWAQIVFLVLGVLGVLGAVGGVATALTAGVAGVGSGGGVDVAEAQRAAAEAQAKALADAQAAMAAAGQTGVADADPDKIAAMAVAAQQKAAKEAREAAEKAGMDPAKAEEAAKAAAAAAEKAAKEAEAAAAKAEKEAAARTAKEEKAAKEAEAKAEKERKAAEAKAAKEAARAGKTAEVEDEPPPPPRSMDSGDLSGLTMVGPIEKDPMVEPKLNTKFNDFLRKRDAIELAIEADPKLLEQKSIAKEYKALWKKTYAIRKDFAKKKGEAWEKDKIINRQKGLKIYEDTTEHVDKLFGLIFK